MTDHREAVEIAHVLCVAAGDDPDREGPWNEWWEESPYAKQAYAILSLLRPASGSVEQRDRDAAADLMRAMPLGGLVGSADIQDGGNDQHYFVQAFARHRLNALKGGADPATDVPIVDDFGVGVITEADHQRRRWGVDHDAGKTPYDWFWLIGYLSQKAADAAVRGDVDKAKHHTISSAAALANWHLALSGGDNRMRPGIAPPAETGGAA